MHAISSYTEEIRNSYLFKAIQPKCNAYRWMGRRIKIWEFRSHNLKCVFFDSPEIETSLMMNHLAYGLFAQMNELTALVGERVQTRALIRHTVYNHLYCGRTHQGIGARNETDRTDKRMCTLLCISAFQPFYAARYTTVHTRSDATVGVFTMHIQLIS